MPEMHREEYSLSEDGVPFTLYTEIRRSAALPRGRHNWHDEAELQICRAGEGTVVVDGVQHPFTEGDIIFVKPQSIHYTYTESELCYSCLILHTTLAERVGIDPAALCPSPRIQDPALLAITAALEEQAKKEEPYRTAKLLRILLDILLALTELPQVPQAGAQGTHAFPEVRGVIDIMRKEYASRLSLTELARRVYTDKYSLSRRFKQATGETVVTYLNRYRCTVAAELLSHGATVAEAAHAVGFENVSFFIKTFKKFTNALPSTYKARKSRNG